MDFSRLTFGDMIDPRRGTTYPATPITFENVNTMDFSTGILVYINRLVSGFAVYHLTQPNVSVIEEYDSPLPRKYVGHVTYLFSKDIDNQRAFAFAPEVLYMNQGMGSLLIFGGTFKYNIFKIAVKYANSDAFIAGVGIQTSKLNIGYTYEIPLFKLSIGKYVDSHEITASYLFNCKNKKDKIKTLRLINL